MTGKHFDPSLPGLSLCSECGAELPHPSKMTLEYFNQGSFAKCPRCGAELDWWTLSLNVLRFDFPLLGGRAYTFLGAKLTIIQIILGPNEVQTLKFAEHDVPSDACIVCINYTPAGTDIFPVELHSNQPPRFFLPKEVTLFGRPMKPEAQKTGHTKVAVTWVPASRGDPALWENTVEAVEAYSNNRFTDMIIPANVAVESHMARLMNDFFAGSVAKRRLDEFLTNQASYGAQLNVILPGLVDRLDIKPLSEPIKSALNKLRRFRNDLAHRGQPEKPLGRDEAAECLCGALFGINYVDFVRPQILKS